METEASAADDGVAHGLGGTSRSIGAALAAARAARGLDLTDIARETRVPIRHLAAIEADNHDQLPALPYAIGFVKAFARAVAVDPDTAASHFRAETSKAAHVPVQPTMTPLDERRLPPRGLVIASIAALVGVGALIIAWSDGAFDAAPPPAPVEVAGAPATPAAAAPGAAAPSAAAGAAAPGAAVPTAVGVGAATAAAPPVTSPQAATAPGATPLPASSAGPPAMAQTAAPPAAMPPAAVPAATGGSGVVITATDDAWFRVSVWDPAAGKVVTVKTGVLTKGERYAPPPTPGLRLWTGRAGALTISVDGRAIPPLGGPVETVKNVSLDPADLRARLAAPAGPLPGRAGPPVG